MQNHPNFDILKTSLFTTGVMKTQSLAAPHSNINRFSAPKVIVPRVAAKIQASRLAVQMSASDTKTITRQPATENTASAVQEKIQDGIFKRGGVDAYSNKTLASKVSMPMSVPAPPKDHKTPFLVEGSYLAKEMWCNEDKATGEIQCTLDYTEGKATDPIVEFNIEEMTYDYQSIATYYEDIWDEKKVYNFEDDKLDVKDDIGPLADMIALAIEDYDKMIYASKLITGDDGSRCIQVNLKDNSKSKELKEDYVCLADYDQFNLELFYEFCRRNPETGKENSSNVFTNLANADKKELDQFVIGTWMNNHLNREQMQAEL